MKRTFELQKQHKVKTLKYVPNCHNKTRKIIRGNSYKPKRTSMSFNRSEVDMSIKRRTAQNKPAEK